MYKFFMILERKKGLKFLCQVTPHFLFEYKRCNKHSQTFIHSTIEVGNMYILYL